MGVGERSEKTQLTDQSRRQFIGAVVAAATAPSQPSAAGGNSHPGALSIQIPVRVNHGNAVAPVGARRSPATFIDASVSLDPTPG